MKKEKYFNSWQLQLLIFFTILVNMSGFFCPLLRNDDPVLYANIAKHIVLSGDWVDLVFNQTPWLDKPHLLFWLVALSFKLFGINPVAYMLPGFLFNLLGGYYTYLLAKKLYSSNDIGLIAAAIYFSTIHLLLSSSIDIRAEAYLLGEIIPACYYWYLYNEAKSINWSYLLYGAFFTALALMTKGLFVLITISSGLVTRSMYQRLILYRSQIHSNNLSIENKESCLSVLTIANVCKLRLRWIFLLILSFVFILPEMITLYLQFDQHPEQIVFGHTHVSGIKWFFWGSQFGRFFGTGPIAINNIEPLHYLFFIHTFLWAFLPWSILFIVVLYNNYRLFRQKNIMQDECQLLEKERSVYLLGSFIPTFILFSLTKFQLDHYTNIIMPFAAILCARWFYLRRVNYATKPHPIFYFQMWFAIILTASIVILSILIFGHVWLSVIIITSLLMLILFITFMHKDDLTKAILYPVLAINLTFVFIVLVNSKIDSKYDLGYITAQYLNHIQLHKRGINGKTTNLEQNLMPVVDYKVGSLTLDFYYKGRYQKVNNFAQLNSISSPYYLLLKANDLKTTKDNLDAADTHIIFRVKATTIDHVLAYLLASPRLQEILTNYIILKVTP